MKNRSLEEITQDMDEAKNAIALIQNYLEMLYLKLSKSDETEGWAYLVTLLVHQGGLGNMHSVLGIASKRIESLVEELLNMDEKLEGEDNDIQKRPQG